MNATTAQAAVKPAASIIVFDSADRRIPRPFGKGLLRSLPTHRVEYSAEDAREWAQMSAEIEAARELAEEEARIEAMAEDAARFAEYLAMAAYASADWEEAELAEVGSSLGHDACEA